MLTSLKRTLTLTTFTLFAAIGCNSDNDGTSNVVVSSAATTTTSTTSKDQNVTVKFAAMVNDQPFACGETYSRVGKAITDTYRITDFRFYLHDVALIRQHDRQKVPLKLVQDGQWQYQNVVMLDFENGCLNGTPQMNAQVIGALPNDNNFYDGICFSLGIPFNLNHISDATAHSPINMSGMLWSWTTGRKFVRIDGVADPTGLNQSYAIHLGSTGCVDSDKSGGEPDGPCKYPNTPEICFEIFDVTKDVVIADVGALLQDANVAYNTPQTAAGCMSANNDPECIDIMPKFGIDFVYNDGINPATSYSRQQMFFRR